MSSSDIGSDGKIYCKHMEEAVKRKSRTPKHPNRDFYCCKRPVRDGGRCDFFLWADKVSAKDGTTGALASVSTTLKEGMGTSSLSGHPIPASPTRLLQGQSSSPLNGSLPETPRSANRIRDIEVGLKQRKQDFSPRHLSASPSKAAGPSASFSGAEAVARPPSPVLTEVDSEVEARPRKTFRSFLGLDYSPQPVTSTIQDEGPSTPKRPRLIPPTVDAVFSGGGLPLTPPQTRQGGTQFGRPEPASLVLPSRKGKEREGVTPSGSVQYGQTAENSGEPQEDSLPLFTLPEDASSFSSASPTIAENILDYTDGVKARVKALLEYMDSFDVTGATKLLQTVERQKMQYEYRDRSQKTRMEELIAERDKLVTEVSRLKDALQCADASNYTKDAEIASLKGR